MVEDTLLCPDFKSPCIKERCIAYRPNYTQDNHLTKWRKPRGWITRRKEVFVDYRRLITVYNCAKYKTQIGDMVTKKTDVNKWMSDAQACPSWHSGELPLEEKSLFVTEDEKDG